MSVSAIFRDRRRQQADRTPGSCNTGMAMAAVMTGAGAVTVAASATSTYGRVFKVEQRAIPGSRIFA